MGCLPILLTMPFLIAFYRVLSVSIELRGAPFFWIPDLSQKDPLFLTPILMGISMFAMQSMTPTAMDPAQQRIMMLMPLDARGHVLVGARRAERLLAGLEPLLDRPADRDLCLLRRKDAVPARATAK